MIATASNISPSMTNGARRETAHENKMFGGIVSQVKAFVNRFRGTTKTVTKTLTSTSTTVQVFSSQSSPLPLYVQETFTVTQTISATLRPTPSIVDSSHENHTTISTLPKPTVSSSSSYPLPAVSDTQPNSEPTTPAGLQGPNIPQSIDPPLLGSIVWPAIQATINIIPTLQATDVRTETAYIFTTLTSTFFIQRCTPSPFPFQLCSNTR